MEFPKSLIGGENVLYTPSAAAEKIITETEICLPQSQLNCSIAKETSSEKTKSSSLGKQKTWARNAKQFKAEENLNKDTNIQLVNKSALYKCNLCPSEYSNGPNLSRHIRNAHESHLLFKCTLCPLKYVQQINLDRHIKIAHETHNDNKITFKCNLCPLEYSNGTNLLRHVRYAHESHKMLFRCNLCSLKYVQRINLNKHIKHAHEKPNTTFKCNLCPSKFPQHSYLKRHIKLKHENPKSFKCNSCEKHFRNSAELDFHMKAHSKTDCDKTFDGKENGITVRTISTKPLKNTSNEIREEISIPETVESYKTVGNGGNFPRSGNPTKKLEKKKRNVSTDKPKLRPQRRNYIKKRITLDYDNKNPKLAQCSLCPKSFVDNHSLKFHFEQVHENPLLSNDQEMFSVKCNLIGHIAQVNRNSKTYSYFFEEQINETDLKDINNAIGRTVECDSENDKIMHKCDMNDETVHLVQFGKARKLLTSENIPNETRAALAKALEMIYRGNLEEDLSKYKCKLCSITCLDYNALDNHMKRHNVYLQL